jgi:hypothetical protein
MFVWSGAFAAVEVTHLGVTHLPARRLGGGLRFITMRSPFRACRY